MPLRILDVSRNYFNMDCGLILGDALTKNSNLRSIDLSYNRFGDLGVKNLLYPLLIASMKEKKFIEKMKTSKSMSLLSQFSQNNIATMVNSQLIKSGLRAINLRDNYMSHESLTYVLVLLEID